MEQPNQPSFQASNAIIYLTYGAFLCVRQSPCCSLLTARAQGYWIDRCVAFSEAI